MPSFNRIALLQRLHKDVSILIEVLQTQLTAHPHSVLLHSPAPGSWSVIQCLDHLNGYGQYYLPLLKAALDKGERQQLYPKNDVFNSGWLGNYFANLMQPKEDGTLKSKMKSPKNHRPALLPNPAAVLAEFAAQQRVLLQLLERAQHIDVGRLRIPISLTKLIKLSAGDTFRFLIAHEQRHMMQALRALSTATGSTATAIAPQYQTGE